MNVNIRKLAQSQNALDAIRQDLIRCGFELEFHACNGMERGDLQSQDPREIDDDGDPIGEWDDSEGFGIQAPHVEVGDDGSVRGGEVRTVGALRPMEFMKAAEALFSKHDWEIDSGCSFHIHLSVPEVIHTYSKSIQAEMMAFILANQTRLPESVRQRIKGKQEYFRFEISTDKYRAIHRHSQKTWEFRLFGNVTSTLDAWRCLLLAIDTLRHAYRVRLRLTPALITVDSFEAFTNLAQESIKHGRSLTQQIRFNKVVLKKQQSA